MARCRELDAEGEINHALQTELLAVTRVLCRNTQRTPGVKMVGDNHTRTRPALLHNAYSGQMINFEARPNGQLT